MRSAIAYATGAALLLACGSEPGAEESGDVPPERGMPSGYIAPPQPCGTRNAADLPLVQLPWRGTAETFLLPGWDAGELALDYEVVPAARVEEVVVSVEFDQTMRVDEQVHEELCPPTIPLGFVGDLGVDNEVVAARIWAGNRSGTGRTGHLYVPVGEGTLTLRTEGLIPEDELDGDWWFIYEPAWGDERAVLAPATVDRSSFTITGLPEGPGLVALVRSDAPRLSATRGVIHAPQGFAGRWPMAATAWYGTALARYPEAPVSLRTVIPPGASTETVRLEDGLALTAGEILLVRLPPRETSGTVSVPCDEEVSISNAGFAEVVVTTGDSERRLEPGAEMTAAVGCGEAAHELSIRGRPLNGRPTLIRIAVASEVL